MGLLIVHEKKPYVNMLLFNLESELKTKIYFFENSNEAINLLIEGTPISFLVCQDNPDNIKILKYLMTSGQSIPYIFVGPEADKSPDIFPELKQIAGIMNLQDILKKINLIKETIKNEKDQSNSEEDKFCRIKTELLLKVVPLKADVYIRLSPLKFVKMFRQGRIFGQEELDKYFGKKKVEYFYILRSEIQGFLNEFQEAISKLIESASLPPHLRATTAAAIQEVASELQTQLGFSPEVQKIAKEAVQLTLQSIGKDPVLSNIYDMIQKEGGSYFFFHSIAVAHISCALAVKLDWPSDTTFHKLTMASIFHDFLLKNRALAEIDNLEELTAAGDQFSKEEIEMFKTHPLKTAEMIRNLKEMPPDVDIIIAQHHERPTGKGFPRNLNSANISPLSALFIVAHDLVKYISFGGLDKGFDQFVRQFKYTKDHTKGAFRKALLAIEFPEPKQPSS